MKAVFVPLSERPFRKFQCGSKGIEIRRASSPVAAQVRKAELGAPVVLSLGYGSRERILGTLGPRWEAPNLAGLPPEVRRRAALDPDPSGIYFDHDAPVLAFAVCNLEASR